MKHSKMIWLHANLYTFIDEQLSCLDDGAMIAVDGKIQWVGASSDLPASELDDAHSIDCQGLVLTPGFIDCHTHLVYAGNRSDEFEKRLEGQTYGQIHQEGGGIQSTVRATRAASFDELYQQSLKRLKAGISHGVTTFEIKSGYGLDLVTEKKMLEVAKKLGEQNQVQVLKTFLGAHTLALEYSDHATYIQDIIENMLPELMSDNLIDFVDGYCETIAFSPELIELLFRACDSLGIPVKLHCDQLNHLGGGLVAARHKAVSVEHLEFSTKEDVQAFKESGTTAVLLPGAYYFLKETQLPPIHWLREYDVPIAIATDCNPGTSPTTSILLMLNMASVLFGLTPVEALMGVTKHAAMALNLEHVGCLKKGYLANCVLWDIEHPRDLVYGFGINPCQSVYSQGIKIYER